MAYNEQITSEKQNAFTNRIITVPLTFFFLNYGFYATMCWLFREDRVFFIKALIQPFLMTTISPTIVLAYGKKRISFSSYHFEGVDGQLLNEEMWGKRGGGFIFDF